jgi:hypothetical protein
LNEAVICPRQNEQIRHKKHEQETDPEPNEGRRENSNAELKKIRTTVHVDRADAFHAFTEQNVASGSEDNHKKNQNVRLQMQFGKRPHSAEYPLFGIGERALSSVVANSALSKGESERLFGFTIVLDLRGTAMTPAQQFMYFTF